MHVSQPLYCSKSRADKALTDSSVSLRPITRSLVPTDLSDWELVKRPVRLGTDSWAYFIRAFFRSRKTVPVN